MINRHLTIAAAILALGVASLSHAALMVEDFAYSSTGTIDNRTGGSGWANQWELASGSAVRVVAGTLSYAGGGYNITQTTTPSNAGKAGSAANFRQAYRDVPSLSGTIWFSFLMENTDSSVATQLVRFQLQPGTGSSDVAANYIELSGGTFKVRYGGAATATTLSGSYADDTVHLVVGKLVVGAGNDSLEMWINPANLGNLGTANFSANTADILGSGLTRIGIGGGGTFSGGTVLDSQVVATIDALRISNEANAFELVTGIIPEPASLALFGAGVSLMVWRPRKRRSPLM